MFDISGKVCALFHLKLRINADTTMWQYWELQHKRPRTVKQTTT